MGDGQFHATHAVAVSPLLRVYVADEGAHRIQYFGMDGAYMGRWGQWGYGTNDIIDPVCVTFQPDGTVYVVERDNHRIHFFSPEGLHRGMWGGNGSANGEFNMPAAAAFAPDGTLFVTDRMNHRVQHFTASGTYLGQFGSYGSGNGQFKEPYGVVVSLQGTVFVTDSQNCRVQYFGTNGIYQGQWGAVGSGAGQFGNNSVYNNGPGHISIDARGYLYVADPNNSRIQVFTQGGSYVGKWGAYGTGGGGFYYPNGAGIAPGWQVYVADEGNSLIQQMTVFVGAETNLHITAFSSTGGYPAIQAEALPGVLYSLERSTNLTDWVGVQSVNAAAGLISVTDAVQQAGARAYYRVVK